MQAIIQIKNEKDFLVKIGGITILERQIHCFIKNHVNQVFIQSENHEWLKRIIEKSNILEDAQIYYEKNFNSIREKSFTNGYVVNKPVLFDSSAIKIDENSSEIHLFHESIAFIPMQALKKTEKIEDIFILNKIYTPAKSSFLVIIDKKSRKEAENSLFKQLKVLNIKDPQKIITLHSSKILLKLIQNWNIHPNLMTILVFIIGFLTILPLGIIKVNHALLITGWFFFLTVVLTSCDGAMARLKYQETYIGKILNKIVNDVVLIMVMSFAAYYAALQYAFQNNALNIFVALVPVLLVISRFLELAVNLRSGVIVSDHKEMNTPSKGFDKLYFNLSRSLQVLTSKEFLSVFILLCGIFNWIILLIYAIVVVSAWWFVSFFVKFVIQMKQDRKIRSQYHGIKACIFDFDGTLVDDMDDFADLAAETIKKYHGINLKLARKKYIETTGLPFVLQLKALFPGAAQNEEAVHAFETAKESIFFEKNIDPQVKETLAWLKKRGIKIAVTSGGFQKDIEQFCKKEGVEFDLILGYKENFEKGPQHFHYLMNAFQIEKKDILFLGDSLKDAEKGLSFGLRFIAKCGTFPKKDFKTKFPGIDAIEHIYQLKKELK